MARDFSQSSSQFLASIDAEIERLQFLREQVAAAIDTDQAVTKTAKASKAAELGKTVRRGMSEEGRRRVAEAQRARWAKQKKASKNSAKAPVRQTSTKQPAKKAVAKRAVNKAARAKTTEQA